MSMDKDLARFNLEDGTAFLVEVDKPKVAASSIERVAAVNTERMVYEASQTLESAIDSITPVASTVIHRFINGMTTPANEIEVSFGLKLTAEAGAILGSVGGDVTFNIKLKWSKEEYQKLDDSNGI